jgi:hypothetical protein
VRRLDLKVEPECGFVREVINNMPGFKDLLVACARRPRPSAGRGGETGFKSNKETDPKAQPSVPQGGLKGAMTRPSTASGLGRQPTKKLTDDELQKDDKLIS